MDSYWMWEEIAEFLAAVSLVLAVITTFKDSKIYSLLCAAIFFVTAAVFWFLDLSGIATINEVCPYSLSTLQTSWIYIVVGCIFVWDLLVMRGTKNMDQKESQ